MKRLKQAVPAVLALLVLVLVCNMVAWLLVPVRQGYGAEWDAYLQEEPDSLDVLFFGSSTVYCDVVPALVWETSGLKSFVMAAPAQPLPITYYYVKEALKSQHPQAIVFEVSGLFFEQYPGHSKSNLAYMPWGINRVLATLQGAEKEEWLGALFPLYYYHDRVYEVTREDIKGRLFPEKDPLLGYTLLTDAIPQSGTLCSDASAETDTYRENLSYLAKIADLCQKEQISLILYLAPTYEQYSDIALARMEQDVSALPGVEYFRCDGPDWPVFHPNTDWYDQLHLNLKGAVPFSRRLGEELAKFGLEVSQDSESWQVRLDYFENLSSAQ